MGLSCGARWAKSLLIMFNLVFWLSGCALLFTGIYTLVSSDNKHLFALFAIDDKYVFIQYLAYALIGVGSLIFIVGFFGCCGAMQESKCMLITYFLFLLLILAAELGVGIMAILYQDQTLNKLETKLSEKLVKDYGRNADFTEAVDYAQTKFECCGIKGPGDYTKSKWKDTSQGANFAKTCCVLNNKNQTDAFKNPVPKDNAQCQAGQNSFLHQQGCLPKLQEFLKEQSKLFTGIGIGIAMLELFGMICAICLCKEL